MSPGEFDAAADGTDAAFRYSGRATAAVDDIDVVFRGSGRAAAADGTDGVDDDTNVAINMRIQAFSVRVKTHALKMRADKDESVPNRTAAKLLCKALAKKEEGDIYIIS